MTNDEAKKMLDYAKEIGCRSFRFGELEAEFYPPPQQAPPPHPLVAALRGIDPGPHVTDRDLFQDDEDPDRGLPKA